MKSLRAYLCTPFLLSLLSLLSLSDLKMRTIGVKKLGTVGESLTSSLRKKCVCVAGCTEAARSPLVVQLLTFQKIPKVENLCLYCQLIYLVSNKSFDWPREYFFSGVQSCLRMLVGSNRVGSPYRDLKGVTIKLDCCLDVFEFGI